MYNQTFLYHTLYQLRSESGLYLRVPNSKYFFISQPKHMLWYSKEASQRDGSFVNSTHMLKTIGKKICTIYADVFWLFKPVA